MTRIIIALLAGAAGIALTLIGLGVDAWLHAQDETLAAREGIFTLSNPGHLLLAAGMALVCGGILSALYITWGMSKANGILGRRWVRVISMQAAGAATAGAVLFALATSVSGHEHPGAETATAGTHVHDASMAQSDAAGVMAADPQPAPAGDALASAQAEGPHRHAKAAAPVTTQNAPAPIGEMSAPHAHADAMPTDGVEAATATGAPTDVRQMHNDGMSEDGERDVAAASDAHTHPQPTAGELACLADLTAQAKAATTRFEDFDVALAEGYAPNVLDPSKTHHSNRAYKRDGVIFDLAKPESLIYVTDDAGNKRFVGVLYHAPLGQGPAPCGAATYWHTHGQCIDTAGTAIPELKDKTCPAGYEHRDGNTEMMHLWFVPRGQRS